MPAPERRRVVGVLAVLTLLAVGGCGAGVPPDEPTPRTPSASAPSTPGPTVTNGPVPDDGASLRRLGYVNGPVDEFSLPRTALVQATVDQPNNVTAVLDQPPPVDVAAYLRRALPATGFTITADDDLTLTFVGHGWTGRFTATGATSAVLLRPA